MERLQAATHAWLNAREDCPQVRRNHARHKELTHWIVADKCMYALFLDEHVLPRCYEAAQGRQPQSQDPFQPT